jgi:actin-related protein 2
MSDNEGEVEQSEQSKVIVCDNGTGFVKCGFAGENFPRHTFQSMLGKPMLRAEDGEIDSKIKLKDIMIGDEAANARQYLEIRYPLENGQIKNWDDMELLWKHTFHDVMGICGEDYDCSGKTAFLTEAPYNPDTNRAKMLKIMFETFNFDRVTVQTQALLTLYAQGELTGVVLDSGDGVSHAVAVYKGFSLEKLTQRLDVAGRKVTEYLCSLLCQRGYQLYSTNDFETVREIKEEFCFTAYDIDKAREFSRETTCWMKTYTLPDGTEIKLGGEQFEAAEAMFDPTLVNCMQPGVATMLHNLIQGAETDIKKSLYEHIVLSGGSTMYPGFPTRLEKELTAKYLEVMDGNKRAMRNFRLHIQDPPSRKNLVYLGASVLGNIMEEQEAEGNIVPNFWVTRKDYDEKGAKLAAKQLSPNK